MALESLPKIAPALFSAEQDLIQIYNKKSDTLGVINASLIGGNTPPSGVSGAIQFSNGSAFASDATNLFWDNTNKRLGVGTNTPSATFQVQGSAGYQSVMNLSSFNYFDAGAHYFRDTSTNLKVQIGGTGQSLLIKGSGSTSATTSLLVQNSAGTELFRVRDDGRLSAQSINVTGYPAYLISNINVMDFGSGLRIGYDASVTDINFYTNGGTRQLGINNNGQVFVGTSPNASAQFQVTSTTRGFLPPVMTTTQKNAIATPASGLVVYDTTTNKLCCYNGSTWNDLF